MMLQTRPSQLLLLLAVLLTGCTPIVNRFMARTFERIAATSDPAPIKIANPVLNDVGISVVWVGHATTLIQIHDKVFLTDPVFTKTVGMISTRYVEPGIDLSTLAKVDYTLISHTHMDHFSYGSLDMLPKNGKLLLPYGAAMYAPEFHFPETREMKRWEALEENDVRITAVPVRHFGGRYGFDFPWVRDRGYTGWVIEYRGKTVFFGGDTGYHPEYFKEVGERFNVDVAILPIGPVEPREFMRAAHVDPHEALRMFEDLRAELFIPMHYGTFMTGLDPQLHYARALLEQLTVENGLKERVKILEIGERVVVE